MQAIIGKNFPKQVIPLIDNAKHTIKIIVFDWRWYANEPSNPVQLFNQSIVRAVKRGVHVFAIANNDGIIETLKSVGVNAKKLLTRNLVHAKIIIIDEKIIVIGSHNYTQSAFTMNYEISAMHDDCDCALQFLQFFESLYNAD